MVDKYIFLLIMRLKKDKEFFINYKTPNIVQGGKMEKGLAITHAALDETKDGEIILRGRIDPTGLHVLQTGPYQREVLSPATILSLTRALQNGSSVPDVDLGMRGERYHESKGTYVLKDPLYIIDGLQRVTACRSLVAEGILPRLGTVVHFGTTEE